MAYIIIVNCYCQDTSFPYVVGKVQLKLILKNKNTKSNMTI